MKILISSPDFIFKQIKVWQSRVCVGVCVYMCECVFVCVCVSVCEYVYVFFPWKKKVRTIKKRNVEIFFAVWVEKKTSLA